MVLDVLADKASAISVRKDGGRFLERYPRLTGTRIYEMIRARGYPGSVIQVRRMIRKHGLRPRSASEAYFALQTMPGEQAQVDWGDFGSLPVEGAKRRIFGFVMVSSWSRALDVTFSFDMKVPAVVRGHVQAFEYFGGVPRTLVYDNMKTVVVERDGDAIRFHPRITELKRHYRFNARVCRPYRAHEKGRVERAIRYLRGSFFAGRTFADIDDLRAQFEVWRSQTAHRRRCPQDDTLTVAEALDAERSAFVALPEHPLDACDVRPAHPKKQPYVRYDTNRYSVPPDCVGRALTIVATETEIRVERDGEEVARHRRSWSKKQTIDDPTHLSALADHKRRGRELKGREWVLARLPGAESIYAHLLQTNARLQPQTMRLVELLESYDTDLVSAAVDRAVERGTLSADSVAYLLEKQHRGTSRPPRMRPSWDRPELDNLTVNQHNLEDYDD
jgi:transposase